MIDFDPQSPEFQDDPYPVYHELREKRPVLYHREQGFWAISRYDDVVDALVRPQIFSSRRSLGKPPPGDPSTSMPMIVVMDPPRHDELRSLVNRAFTPRRIAGLEARIRGNETTTNLISNAAVLMDSFLDERSLLVEDRSLIPMAVEEFLCFESPVQGVERIATEDVTVRGSPDP